jgi:alanine dehydrogenase
MPDDQPLFLSDADTRRILTWPDVIGCLATAYRDLGQPGAAPPRIVARLDRAWLRALAAMSSTRRHMGAKLIAYSRERHASYLIALWSQDTAELVCLLDAQHITAMRTAGTSAVAVDRLLPAGGLRVAVLGAGAEASAHVSAIAAVRPIAALAVFSPTPASRQRFAERFSAELGIDCRPETSARAAISGADLVLAAARSHDESPILEGAWLEHAAMVVSIGSTLPEQREVDPEVIRRAGLIVCDVPEEVVHETGDMLAASAAGVPFEDRIVPLADVVQGRLRGRPADTPLTLYKSVGSGLQDVAVSEMCFEKARTLGLGSRLAAGLSIKGRR